MVNDDFEYLLIGSPWRSHGTIGEVEGVSHRDLDDADVDDDIDDDTDDDPDGTDDDNDGEATWWWWW